MHCSYESRFMQKPPLEKLLLLCEVPGCDLSRGDAREGSISGRLMLVGGEGESLGHLHAWNHPRNGELWLEMVGEGLATCAGGLQRRTLR